MHHSRIRRTQQVVRVDHDVHAPLGKLILRDMVERRRHDHNRCVTVLLAEAPAELADILAVLVARMNHHTVRTLERLGISAVIIEDKVGLKQNSLFGTDAVQTQDTIEGFCAKIHSGKQAQITDDFMIIARIESLIAGKPVEDALERALAYVAAGADGVMIHSRNKDGEDIREFCRRFREQDSHTPRSEEHTV